MDGSPPEGLTSKFRSVCPAFMPPTNHIRLLPAPALLMTLVTFGNAFGVWRCSNLAACSFPPAHLDAPSPESVQHHHVAKNVQLHGHLVTLLTVTTHYLLSSLHTDFTSTRHSYLTPSPGTSLFSLPPVPLQPTYNHYNSNDYN